MNFPEPVYQLALTRVPQIGCVLARALTEAFGSAESIFRASRKALCEVDGISDIKASCIKGFTDYESCLKEWEFLKKHEIELLFLTNENYPKRLLNCYDPPTLLFYKGTANLNASRIINIIGTRNQTEYGKHLTEKLVETLAPHNILIVS
nr:DNA-processing protein DprA [Chitinophagaceae bacterium]